MQLIEAQMVSAPQGASHDGFLGDVFRYGFPALCRGSGPRR